MGTARIWYKCFMRAARWVLVSGLGGVIIGVTGLLTLNHSLPVAVGHTQDQEAFLGVWRLFAGCVVLVGALLQTRWRVLGAVLTLLFGLFEIFVNVVSRDVLQWPFTALASGALLAAAGGAWALLAKPQRRMRIPPYP